MPSELISDRIKRASSHPVSVHAWRLPALTGGDRDADTYRPDVDGLRALAILLVAFFHAGIGPFGGGFVGVDVFFVISGFLITRIIAREQERGTFSILQFYERRVRRIAPALILVVACCTIVALRVMLPDQLAAFAKSVIYLMFFSSNIFFWHQHGYFEAQAGAIPLLHTWSIAVEEQFYIVFPTLMFLVRRVAAPQIRWVFGLFALASFAVSVWGVQQHPGMAFYLAPSRSWELLLGSLLALGAVPPVTNRSVRNFGSLCGFGLIFYSVFWFSSDTPFPGLAALPPTFGTALLIHVGTGGNCWSRQILSFRPMVAIGLISYSLYLWHWPLLVFGQYVQSEPLGVVEKCGLLMLSAVLAIFTLVFVEQPFRRKSVCASRTQVMRVALACALGFVSVAGLIVYDRGIVGPIDDTTRGVILANLAAKIDWSYPTECQANYQKKFQRGESVTYCGLNFENTSQKILFWGDSEIEQLYPMIIEIAREGALAPSEVMFATSGGCPPIMGLNRVDGAYGCDSFNNEVLARARSADVSTIVLGGNVVPDADIDKSSKRSMCAADNGCARFQDKRELLTYIRRNLGRELHAIAEAGKNIIVVLPFPAYHPVSPPDYLIRKSLYPGTPQLRLTRENHLAESHDMMEIWAQEAAVVGARSIDPSEALCPREQCIYQNDKISLYKDGFHLTANGARTLKVLFMRSLTQPRSVGLGTLN